VRALEDTSLDSDQLRKGRRTANSGQVGAITISPGRIAATVYSSDDTYDAVVLVDRLSDDDWRLFLDQVAARAGHIAALLDGELPHELVDAPPLRACRCCRGSGTSIPRAPVTAGNSPASTQPVSATRPAGSSTKTPSSSS